MMSDQPQGPSANLRRYDELMHVVRNRLTSRQFNPQIAVPREHIEMVLEAARHAPSGANAQPWHYIAVTDPEVKRKIADYFVEEQRRRAKLKMKFPTPNYRGLESAPGFIVVVADFRFMRAFPVLLDGSELDKQYQQNAERILLQSVAASTMSAHLAAAALGYQVWWVTAIGQEAAQTALKPLLGIPQDLAVIDIMLFGVPAKPPYKRWKKTLPQIMHWERFNMANYMTIAEIDAWVRQERHKVMYRDESKID
ncbi:MAG: nitroreductase family protein [Hyphomonadaceae bacterium]|jgi:nitroreductase|nr:nitroreductase family protein [Hyphomonadaceae bacterium]